MANKSRVKKVSPMSSAFFFKWLWYDGQKSYILFFLP